MARTPSMTVEEAEALLGSRGHVHIDKNNRAIVKKWLVARGFPSGFVGGLTYLEMQLAYNDTQDTYLRGKLTDKLNYAVAEGADYSVAVAANEPDPVEKITPANVNDPIGILRDLLLNGWKPGVDSEQVRELIKAECAALYDALPDLIAKHTPITRLEIKLDNRVIDLGTAPRHKFMHDMLMCVMAGIPVAVIGPAGSGKTTAAEQCALALQTNFYMNGAISGAHEYLGFVDAHGVYHTTPFRQAYEHGGTYCADEIDAGDPAAILVINSALANGHMPFPDRAEPVAKHANFRIIACANTFMTGADRQYVGRNQLDAATIDRFAVIHWDYDEVLEAALCGWSKPKAIEQERPRKDVTPQQWCERVQKLRAAAVAEEARIIISPRASIYGCKLLGVGMHVDRVEELIVWKGLDADTRKRIEARAR